MYNTLLAYLYIFLIALNLILPTLCLVLNMIGAVTIIVCSFGAMTNKTMRTICYWTYPVMLLTELYGDFYVQKSISFLDYLLIVCWSVFTIVSIFNLVNWIKNKIKLNKEKKNEVKNIVTV